MAPLSAYEQQRNENIARNKELLKGLGLDQPLFEPKEAPRLKEKKRKHEQEVVQPSKSRRIDENDHPTEEKPVDPSAPRRSARNAGRKVDYTAERALSSPIPVHSKSMNETGEPKTVGSTRIHDPKTYGAIPGIEVGTWWETRQACSTDAVHAPWVAGISAGPDGAYSVALSGGYEDDVDLGYAFTFTGSGGRDLRGTKNAPKNLRTAPQSCDQDPNGSFNKALRRSVETRKPVRVIRGFKLDSPYAPSEGYRYDGLYIVEKAWSEKGLQGYLVCKFALKRLPGQPPLPRNDIGNEEP